MATSVLAQPELEEVKSEKPDTPPSFDRTMGALSWRFLSESSIFAMRMIVTVILARLLPVEAFGLLTLVMIVMNFAYRISQLGMAPAIIQRKDLTGTHIRVAFTVSVLSGIVITGAIWLGAPLVATVLRNEEVTPVLRLISLSFLFSSLGSTASSLLERRLNYRRLFGVELSTYAVGYALVGVALALTGFGVWALAWAAVVESILRAGFLFVSSPHPVRPSLSRLEVRQLLNFGVGSSLSRIANYAALNGDYFVVGRWLGAASLGLYSRSYQLISLPMYQFSSVISSVLFPVYSRIQDDTESLRRAYIASVFFSSIIVIPLLTVLAIAAPEVMAGLFGPQWTGSVLPLQILCVGGVFHSIYNLGDSLARAKGAVYIKFWCHFVYALCVIVGSILGTKQGIEGVAVGVVIALGVIYVLLGQLSIKLTSSSWTQFLVSQLPGVIVGAVVAALALPVALALRATEAPHLVTLACTSIAALVGALAAGLLLPTRWLNQTSLGAVDKLTRYCFGSLKTRLKALLWRNQTVFKTVEVLYDNALLLHHIVQNGFWRSAAGFRRGILRKQPQQEPITWNVEFPRCESAGELIAWLRARGVQVCEGGHTFYLPPQDALREVIPSVVAFYPPGTGFKVLKDCRHPARARYLNKHHGSLLFLKRLIGTPHDQLISANLMYTLGIGARIWDLTCWKAADRYYSAFVVEHVKGDSPTIEQCSSFLTELKQLNAESHLRILIPKWEQNVDFMPPHCNKNLLYSAAIGQARYVDFQNFGLSSPNAWSRHIIASAARGRSNGRNGHSKAVSTSSPPVPKQDRDKAERKRWGFISSAMASAGLQLNGRVVLEVGKDSTTILRHALTAGAAWGVRWLRPEDVAHYQSLLFSFGATRITVVGADLQDEYRLEEDVPDQLRPRLPEAILYYSPGIESVGFWPEGILELPWRILVYEGSETESLEDGAELAKSTFGDELDVVASSYLPDDSSNLRPVTILIRPELSYSNTAVSVMFDDVTTGVGSR